MLSLMIWKQSAKESLATSFKHSNTPKQTSSSPANPNQEQPGTRQNHQKRFRYRHDGQRLINELDQPGLLHPCGLETLLIKHKRQQSGKKGLPSSQPSPSDDPRSIQDKVQRRLRMLERHEDKVPVVTAVNLAYDMILPRKQKNPLSGITLLNDSKDCSTKPEMTLVMTCTEAIHSWWLNAQVSIGITENKWFKMKKTSGISHVISSDGQHTDLELGQLRFGERQDVLVEVEISSAREVYRTQSQWSYNGDQDLMESTLVEKTGTDAFFWSQMGGEVDLGGMMSETDAFTRFYEAQFEEMNNNMILLEVNVSYRDVQAGKNVAQLA
ncbi:hypothetical protein PtB15_1B632 [Puccinia triticina]|nr:hypothetical protein PtB15_1B632 [Puccinia triticina]